MKHQLLNIALFTLLNGSIPASAENLYLPRDPRLPAITEAADEAWCRDVRTGLDRTLRIGAEAPTDEEERAILLGAIARARTTGPERFHHFFRFTLQAATTDMGIYEGDPSRQAFLLRRYIEFALEDLAFLERSRNSHDHGPYVIELLHHALQFGLMAPTSEAEILFLQHAAERAIQLLDLSDYRRTPGYACSLKTLHEGLEQANYPGITLKTRVELLRDVLETSIKQIGYCR